MCIWIEGAADDNNVTAQHMFFERQELRQQIIQIYRWR